jgi:transcriptional regulator with XRE-family HTH domain
MSKVRELHRTWSTEPSYRAAYEALEGEFSLARVLIQTRSQAGLSQAELAERMQTSQSYIARIEGGRVRPSTAVLERLAKATGTRLQIRFVPELRSHGKVPATLSRQPTRELRRSGASIGRAARDAR